jgi:hypothetical protein
MKLLIAQKLLLSLIVLVMFALGSQAVKADEVNFAGSTLGCFGLGCTPAASANINNRLIFDSSTFSGRTVNGFFPLGDVGNPSSNFNNLGSLTLFPLNQNYNTPFTLQVNFTEPDVNGNPVTFTAVITGSVASHDGGVFVDFDNTVQTFNFDVGCRFGPGICATGSFSFSVNDTSLHSDGIVPLTGQITSAQQASPVPEPTSLLLLSSGVLTLTASLRRRRKNQKS